jgi:hypothetical protein
MKYIIYTVIGILLFSCSVNKTAEMDNYPSPSTDWTNGNCPCREVSIYLMEDKNPPSWLNLEGEGVLDLSNKVKTIEDLPELTLAKIIENVQKVNGCVVFIDLRDYYGSEMFPMRKIDKVYFYWGKCK